jgi:hypothetical protein
MYFAEEVMVRFGQLFAPCLGFVWRIFRVLWVCRVAALSAALGGLLIVKLEQARDLFADTGLTLFEWGCFFGLLFVWAWLVHGMARRVLQFDEWVPEAHRPDGLARRDRRQLRREFGWIAKWTPRVLGLIVFIATAAALWLTRENLMPAEALDPVKTAIALTTRLLVATAVTAGFYLWFIGRWRSWRARLSRRTMDPPLLSGAQSVLRLLALLLVHPQQTWPRFLQVFDTHLNRTLMLFAFAVTILFAVALVLPATLAGWFPRVIFLPVLLGGGVLLLGEIASLSHRYMTPLLVCLFIVGGYAGYLLTHYNDVRWIGPPPAAVAAASIRGERHQLGINEAIQRWKTDNHCTPTACPRPIVIAGAGGASRAGFYTVTVVGAMMDAAARDPGLGNIRSRIFALSTVSGSSVGAVMMRAAWMDALQNKQPDQPPCREGGTAAWFQGVTPARQDGTKARPLWRDCFQQLMAGDFLSPVFVGLAYRDLFPMGGSDRSGLLEQSFERWYAAMTRGSGDECVRDDTRGLCRSIGHLPDRADPTTPGDWIPLLFVNGTSVATGRRVIVSDVRVACAVDGKRDHLFLGYAYDYRAMRDPTIRNEHTDCADIVRDPPGKDIDMRLSSVALMSARFPIISTPGVVWDTEGNKVDSVVDGGYFENDGLATAADIVRELQINGLHPVVIRIVNEPDPKLDEQPDLKPSELVSSASIVSAENEKERVPPREVRILRDGEQELLFPPIPTDRDRSPFDSFTAIGRALYATRSGHEDGHLDYLRGTLEGPLTRIGVDVIQPDQAQGTTAMSAPTPLCRSPVKEATAMQFVSMSWWLSQPVQAYLDAQLCRPQAQRLICVLKLTESDKDDGCWKTVTRP